MAADSIKPAYLISGTDEAKVDSALSRLRARAEREGGQGSLETFAGSGQAGPDPDELIGAIPAMSLMAEQRYLLADGVDRWRATQVKRVAEALEVAPPQTTVVFVARGKPPKGLGEAVKKAGGDLLAYDAPTGNKLPQWVVGEARTRGLSLSVHGARELVRRVGENTLRLSAELDRIALWAGPEPEPIDVAEIVELTSDGSERKGWALGDAVVSRDAELATIVADELTVNGEAATPLIYGMVNKLRCAHLAAIRLEQGRAPREIESELPMAPYPSKLLVRSVRGTSPGELSDAMVALADLEWWTRGGSDYDEHTAVVLGINRAAGGDV